MSQPASRASSSISADGALNLNLPLRPLQREVFRSLKRFNVLLAHRRWGKTYAALVMLIVKALQCPLPRPQVGYYAPTYSQAKKVAWAYLREFLGTMPGVVFNEAELKATLPTGAVVMLGSGDNPDSSRGMYFDWVVLDEPAQMPARLWTEVLRPALSDRKGGALFIGTPMGRHGLLYDSYQAAGDDPEWGRMMYRASETGIIEPAELDSARRLMTKAEFEQEFECSFDAAVRGAYYGEVMTKLEADGRITKVPHDPGKQVHVVLDLGIADATAAWFVQIEGRAINAIAHAEYTNMGLPDIVADWRARPYHYGKIIAPHDVEVRELGSGKTRKETLRALGCDVIVAPNLPVAEGIEATRQLLPRMWFDAVECKHGIECLRQYRSDWDDKQGVLRLRPLHDWTSHSADSLRMLAVTGTAILEGDWGGTIDYSNMDKLCA